MRNVLAWTMMAVAVMTVPALAGGGRMPPGGRTSSAIRTGTPPSATPPVSGSGRVIELGTGYSILDQTSIFDMARGTPPPPPPPPPLPTDYRTPAQPRALPVFRAAVFDDIGPIALVEIPGRAGPTTVEYLREGDTFSWDGSTVEDISLDTLSLAQTSSGGLVTTLAVTIGHDLGGRQVGTLPTAPSYLSLDMGGTARNTSPGTLRFNRTRTPGSTGLLNSGTFTAPGGVPESLGTLVNSLDPPLPPGSADAIANRMAQRRQIQLGAGPATLPTSSGMR